MANILYITNIQIDFGALRLLPDECARSGITTESAGTTAAWASESIRASMGCPVRACQYQSVWCMMGAPGRPVKAYPAPLQPVDSAVWSHPPRKPNAPRA